MSRAGPYPLKTTFESISDFHCATASSVDWRVTSLQCRTRRSVEWTAGHCNTAVTRWESATGLTTPRRRPLHSYKMLSSPRRSGPALQCPKAAAVSAVSCSPRGSLSRKSNKQHSNHTVCSFLATALRIALASELSNRENRCALLTVVTSSHWIIFREKSAPTVDLYVSENTLSTKRLMIEVLPHAALPTTMIL